MNITHYGDYDLYGTLYCSDLKVNGQSPSDTKKTAGSTNSTSQLFLIGATSQGANPQTYSNKNVYVTNGELTANTISITGSASNTGAKISSDTKYNMWFEVNGKYPIIITDDGNSNTYVAPALA
jgi:hypothetical protein